MSDLDNIRRKFYDDDDELPSTAGPVRSPSSTAAASSSRAAPYPPSYSRSRTSDPKGKQRQGPPTSRLNNTSFGEDPPNYDGAIPNNNNSAGFGRAAFGNASGAPAYARNDAMDLDLAEGAREGVMNREREESDVKKLLRAWQNERHSPDILPTKDALLGNILDSIRQQTSDVNALRTAEDLSEEDHYMMMLVQTEVERMKFVVRSYVRCRLQKIEQFAGYILSHDNAAELQPRLTTAELRHAQQYGALVVKHFSATVLDHLPESQRGLDDEVPMMPSMITEPDKDKAVFFRALEECGQVRLPDGTGFEVKKGTIHLMRYRTIEHLLLRDEIELV